MSGFEMTAGNRTLSIAQGVGYFMWARDRIGFSGEWPKDSVALKITDEASAVKAVIVYNHFHEASCCAHVATDGSKNWATKGMLYGVFYYPFVQMNLRRVTFPIAEKNIKAQMMALRLGFHFEARLLDGCIDDNEVIMGMLRAECPWINGAV